jgi:hypothetical protein
VVLVGVYLGSRLLIFRYLVFVLLLSPGVAAAEPVALRPKGVGVLDLLGAAAALESMVSPWGKAARR